MSEAQSSIPHGRRRPRPAVRPRPAAGGAERMAAASGLVEASGLARGCCRNHGRSFGRPLQDADFVRLGDGILAGGNAQLPVGGLGVGLDRVRRQAEFLADLP
jgi:hypothetical protein